MGAEAGVLPELALGDHTLQFRVTDEGGLSDETDVLTVQAQPSINSVKPSALGGDVEIEFTGMPDVTYFLWTSEDLKTWTIDQRLPAGTTRRAIVDSNFLRPVKKFYMILPQGESPRGN